MQGKIVPNNNTELQSDTTDSNNVGVQGNGDLDSQDSVNGEAGEDTSERSWDSQAEYQVYQHFPTPIVTKDGAHLDGYHLTSEYHLILSAYRYYLHFNVDTNLDVGVADNAV